jgi:glycosyltransferase involved in cell wall biosynthesis
VVGILKTPEKEKKTMKRKALIFIEDGSFTYDNRVIREATALVAAGWDITVISQKYRLDPFYKEINASLRAYYYPKPTAESAIGHIVEHSISLFWGTLLTFWVFVYHGFKVFHACNPMDILWLIAMPYKILGKKFIYDQHDLCPELFLSRDNGNDKRLCYKILLALEKASYTLSDAVVATNETYKQIAIKRGLKKPGEIFVVRNGPDLDKFRLVDTQKSLKKDCEILVGYLGNMNLQDGADYLLEAAFEIEKKHDRSDILFMFIGGGSQQQRLLRRSRKMGLSDNVFFTGRITDEQMLDKLSACDICVQPDPMSALNNKSTMNKAMEYMALEKPVVAFDLKETRISCGDAALYAMPNNVTDLADKILHLADNPALRFVLGKRGRKRVERELSWSHSIPNLLSAYEHALARVDYSVKPVVRHHC